MSYFAAALVRTGGRRLGERQEAIEKALARKHLHDGTLVLYDVSSSYVEGRCCELARLGYNRDGKKGKLQIVYGLLCAADGCPVAIEVFEGDTGDPRTLAAQIDKVKKRFALDMCQQFMTDGEMEATPQQLDTITTNMVVLATYWLSFQFVQHPRQYNDPDRIRGHLHGGSYHIFSVLAPYLRGKAREAFEFVVKTYPDSDAGRLAKQNLDRLTRRQR